MAVYTLADEIARKKAAGEDRNYGKVPAVPAKATIQPAPVTQVQPTVAKTVVQPAPIAPIANAATNTVNPAPVTGYGQGGTYGKTPGLGAAYAANKALTSTEAGRSSEITRSQGVIAELQKALQTDPNNADLQTRLAGANKYLTVNLGYKPGEVGVSGSAVGADQYGANEYQNEVDSQISAYEGELDSAKIATQFGIDTNQNYLNESLDQLKGSEAVALDQAQQTQNRFGGLYSGGLGYQSGAINSSYANQRGGLARDVAGRNQQLLDQYGSKANAIATQIQNLKSAAPGIIRDKILEFKMKTADLTGEFNGERTLQGQQQDFNQMDKNRYYDFDVNKDTRDFGVSEEQRNLDNAYNQADITGVIGAELGKKYGLPANTPTQSVKESNRNYALDQQKTKADIANMNADNARLSSGGSGGGSSGGGSSGGGSTKLPALTTYANLLQDQFMPYDPVTRTRKLTNPDALERTILSSGYSEAQMQQLYDLFGLNLDSSNSSDRPVSGPLPME